MRSIAFIFAVAVTTVASLADVVQLNDGRTLEGDVKKTPDGWTVNTGAAVVEVKPEDVKSISAGASTRESSDDAGLSSLRRSVSSIADPHLAIDKYKRFIATAKGAAGATAQADLLVWQDRLDRKLIKVGSAWITPEEAAVAKEKYGDQLIDARAKLMDGRTKDAKAIVDMVLAGDAQQPAALYLKGVLAFAESDIPTARKSFDAAVAIVADHGPTLNNLAVVMMRQNQAPAALNTYARALNASPGDPRILDNTAEALNTLSTDAKLATAVKKTTAVFAPLDIAMANRMAQDGYFRWGATWVSKEEIDRLTALEKEVRDQMAKLDADFKSSQDAIRQYEEEIDANNRAMRRIEASSTYRDEFGRVIRSSYPPVYFTLQQDNAELLARQRREQDRIEQMRAEAKVVKAKLPAPRYTGAQRLIGPEGTPGLPPLSPPVQPKIVAPAAPVAPTTVPANPGPPPRAQTP